MTDALSADDPYYVALGLFIDMFANVETHLQVFVWNLSGTKPDVARALFRSNSSGVESAKQTIRKLFEAKGFEEPDLFKDAIDQLTKIASARNLIVHYGSSIFDEDIGSHARVVTNHIHEAIPEKIKRLRVTPELLRGMVDDLGLINMRISHFEIKYILGSPIDEAEWLPMLKPGHDWSYKVPNKGK